MLDKLKDNSCFNSCFMTDEHTLMINTIKKCVGFFSIKMRTAHAILFFNGIKITKKYNYGIKLMSLHND